MSEPPLTAAAFEAMPMEAAVLDAEGTIVRTNPAWRKFGLENDADREDWAGENYLAACEASDDRTATAVAEGLRDLLAGERETFELEYPCHSPDEQRWFILTARPFEHAGDVHLLVLHVNITERRLAEEAVAAANEHLETITGVLSHDLRNPLNVAQGVVELLGEDVDHDDLDRVADALDRMERIIQDAVSLARGESPTEPTAVDLASSAREAWASVVTDAAELEVTGTLTFEADPGLLANLLENLFANAVEHAGSEVTVRVVPLEDGFAVADDGPGIPEDRREAVFEAGESGAGGTGLGLSIVRRVADAHGWSVELTESDAGGARFEVHGVRLVE